MKKIKKILFSKVFLRKNNNSDTYSRVPITDTEEMNAIASEYIKNKNYEKARAWYEKAADQGDAVAQYSLGFMYYYGYGVAKSYVKARRLYGKAAKQKHAKAQYTLGVMYDTGSGVKKNYMKARKWYEKAAEQGEATAQYNLGIIYMHGNGVMRDDEKAREWYEKAAAQGHVTAQYSLTMLESDVVDVNIFPSSLNNYNQENIYLDTIMHNAQDITERAMEYLKDQNYVKACELLEKASELGDEKAQIYLGNIYYNGYGVPHDYEKARQCFEKAAELGDVAAQYNLGIIYYNGDGVLKDNEIARKWFEKASKQGDAASKAALKKL